MQVDTLNPVALIEVRPACPVCRSPHTLWNGRDGTMIYRKCTQCRDAKTGLPTTFRVLLLSAAQILEVKVSPPNSV